MNTIENIKKDIEILFKRDTTDHGINHINRVLKTATEIGNNEGANLEIITIAVLLHDADDYKVFGQACANNLTNTKSILNKHKIDNEKQNIIIDIIKNMGYSKSLEGIRPSSLEGKIVSDADMIDAMGALGLIRCLSYSISKNNEIFNKNLFPELDLSTVEYQNKNRKSATAINHFFEKLLKIQSLLFTDTAKEIAQSRQDFMISFLRQFFTEQNLDNWDEYLDNYLKV